MRAFLLVVAFFLSFPVQAAKQSATPNRFGAIAYHRATEAWGVAYDMARARDANVAALRQCGQNECVVVHKFKNGCAALATGPKHFAATSGATRGEAETKAMERCGAGCKLLAWGCTR